MQADKLSKVINDQMQQFQDKHSVINLSKDISLLYSPSPAMLFVISAQKPFIFNQVSVFLCNYCWIQCFFCSHTVQQQKRIVFLEERKKSVQSSGEMNNIITWFTT